MKKKKKQILLFSGLAFVALGVLAGVLVFGKKNPGSTEYRESDRSDVVLYDGKEYQYNEHLSNYLFLGIDTREQADAGQSQVSRGRADAIYLLSYDRVEKKAVMLSIPRDTMTQIQMYSVDGTDLGMAEEHINMQYIYGDGKEESCRLMKEAVSNLLYGIPIQGYCALNMDGIPSAVRILGNVEVVVPNDSLESLDSIYKAGNTVSVTKENAEQFVRYRDITVAQSAITRMERQKVFMEAFMVTAREKGKQDKRMVLDMYEELLPYMVTSMGTDVFVQLFDATYDAEEKFMDIPGEAVAGSEYDEYHINETELYELVLEQFYQEVKDN